MMSIGTMAELKCVVFWGVFTLLWALSRGDLEVSCQFSRTCILPCSFPPGDQVVIHWIRQEPSKLQVHSYYHNQDQLGQQSDEFKGRTSLYNKLISTGNASLQLSNVMVQVEGRYQCYTSTINGNKETFIQLKVYAPVEKVNIDKLGNTITCSSDWIYPRPTLSWNINSAVDPQETLHTNEQKLYKISSYITLPADYTDGYSCTISTTKSLFTFYNQTHKNSSHNEARLDCQPVNTPLNYFTWKFNHNQLILTWKETSNQATEGWKSHVNNVSNNGSLWLKDLTFNQEGMYTCQSGNNDGKYEKSTVLHIINVIDGGSNTAGSAVGVIFVLLGIISLIFAGVICCQKKDVEVGNGGGIFSFKSFTSRALHM